MQALLAMLSVAVALVSGLQTDESRAESVSRDALICLRNTTDVAVSAVVTRVHGDRVTPYAFELLRPSARVCLEKEALLEVRLLPGDEYAERAAVIFPDAGIRPLGDECDFPTATARIVDVVEVGNALSCVVTASVSTSVASAPATSGRGDVCIENATSERILVLVKSAPGDVVYPYADSLVDAARRWCLPGSGAVAGISVRPGDDFFERHTAIWPWNGDCVDGAPGGSNVVVTNTGDGFVCKIATVEGIAP